MKKLKHYLQSWGPNKHLYARKYELTTQVEQWRELRNKMNHWNDMKEGMGKDQWESEGQTYPGWYLSFKKGLLAQSQLKRLDKELTRRKRKSIFVGDPVTAVFVLVDNIVTPIRMAILKHFQATKIQMPPGHFYATLGKLILNKKTYERVMEPSILTLQQEHFEYYSQGSFKMARWVKIRFFFEFLTALGLNLPVIKQLVALAK